MNISSCQTRKIENYEIVEVVSNKGHFLVSFSFFRIIVLILLCTKKIFMLF